MQVKEQIERLVKLQDIDSTAARIKKQLAGVDRQLADLAAALEKAEKEILTAADEIQACNKRYRSLESDINTNTSRIGKSREKLRAVKTNKEYQSLLKEIDDMKALNSRVEDEMLECLETVERLEDRQQKQLAAQKEIQERVAAEEKRIQKEAETSRAALEELQVEWRRISAALPHETMDLFKRVRHRVGLTTIVAVTDEVCQGCNLNIPPQTFNELQRCEKMMFCPHCQRIIYPMMEVVG